MVVACNLLAVTAAEVNPKQFPSTVLLSSWPYPLPVTPPKSLSVPMVAAVASWGGGEGRGRTDRPSVLNAVV